MRIDVFATPNASRTRVGGVHDGALKVRVVAVPEKGRANDAIVLALAKALDVRKSQIQLVGGAASRRKTFEVSEEVAVLMPVGEHLLSH
jgi:uncharacterized protein